MFRQMLKVKLIKVHLTATGFINKLSIIKVVVYFTCQHGELRKLAIVTYASLNER